MLPTWIGWPWGVMSDVMPFRGRNDTNGCRADQQRQNNAACGVLPCHFLRWRLFQVPVDSQIKSSYGVDGVS